MQKERCILMKKIFVESNANGNLITDNENTVTYAGNYQYENDTSSKKFFADGYIDCSGGEPVACFYLKDHLGNGRMVIGRCRII